MNWKKAFQVAAVYVGSVVGAGFATGKEIVEFFSRFGSLGMLGIIISGLCFIYFGVKIMTIAIRIKAENFQQLNQHIFGDIFSPIVNIILFFMLIGVTAVMLSGVGSVFTEQLQLSRELGVIITIILALIILVVGTKGLVLVNSIVVPLLIINSLFLAFQALQLPDFWHHVQKLDQFQLTVFSSAFAYASFNLTLTMAILVPTAKEIGDEKVVKAGGVIGGIALTLVLLASHVTLVQLPDLLEYHIPMAVLVKNLAPYIYFFFIIVIYGEIFTSVIGNIYGLERYIKKILNIRTVYIGIMILSVTYMISKIDYGVLLSTLYPLFGYISLIFLLLLSFKKA